MVLCIAMSGAPLALVASLLAATVGAPAGPDEASASALELEDLCRAGPDGLEDPECGLSLRQLRGVLAAAADEEEASWEHEGDASLSPTGWLSMRSSGGAGRQLQLVAKSDWHSFFPTPLGQNASLREGNCASFGCLEAFDMARLSDACQCYSGCHSTPYGNVCCPDFAETCRKTWHQVPLLQVEGVAAGQAEPLPEDVDVEPDQLQQADADAGDDAASSGNGEPFTKIKHAFCHNGSGASELATFTWSQNVSFGRGVCKLLCQSRRKCDGIAFGKASRVCHLLTNIDIPMCEENRAYVSFVKKVKQPLRPRHRHKRHRKHRKGGKGGPQGPHRNDATAPAGSGSDIR